MECMELAPAFEPPTTNESASKLDALQTLREVRQASGTTGPNSYWKDSERLKFLRRFPIFGA